MGEVARLAPATLPADPNDPLVKWLFQKALHDALMAAAGEGTRALRSLYPVHFLLLRVQWAEQQLAHAQPTNRLAVVLDELESYGLAAQAELSLWGIVEALLEERFAWQFELDAEGTDEPQDEPRPDEIRPDDARSPLRVLRELPAGGLEPVCLLLVGGEPLAATSEGKVVEFDGAGGHHTLGTDLLRGAGFLAWQQLASDWVSAHGAAYGLYRSGQKLVVLDQPAIGRTGMWRWRVAGLGTICRRLDATDGVAFLWRSDGPGWLHDHRKDSGRQELHVRDGVVACKIMRGARGAVVFLATPAEVRMWRRGSTGTRLVLSLPAAASAGDRTLALAGIGRTLCVCAGGPQGGAAWAYDVGPLLEASTRQAASAPDARLMGEFTFDGPCKTMLAAGETSFALLGTDGHLSWFDPSGPAALTAVQVPGLSRVDLLTTNQCGAFAAWSAQDDKVVVFEMAGE